MVFMAMVMLFFASPGAHAAPTATTTALQITQTTVPYGTPVELKATVTHGSNLPATPGPVAFCDIPDLKQCSGIHLIGTAQVDANGVATMKFVPRLGAHTVYAIFVGTTAYASSASQQAQGSLTVDDGRVVVSIDAPQGGPPPAPYTLTAKVSAQGSRTGPTEAVVFQDLTAQGAQIGSGQLGTAGSPTVTLSPTVTYSSLQLGASVQAIGDFNNDGYPDVAVLSTGSTAGQYLDVFLNKADGSGVLVHQLPSLDVKLTPNEPYDANNIQVGHFDTDNKLDLVVSYQTTKALQVLKGDGAGTFAPQGKVDADGASPMALAVGDFNQDGHMDVAAAIQSAPSVIVFTGLSNLSLTKGPTSTVTGATQPASISAGYVDGDNLLDIVVGDQTVSVPKAFVLLGNAATAGTFTSKSTISTGTAYWANAFVITDLNGDTKSDVALVVTYSQQVDGPGVVILAVGDGTGDFATPTPITGSAAWKTPMSLDAGDFEADGKQDLVVVDYALNTAVVLSNDGSGTFTDLGLKPELAGPVWVTATDISGDGIPDILGLNGLSNGTSVNVTTLATTAQATATNVNALGTGTHYVTAAYGGDSNYQGNTAGNNQTLTAEKLTTSLQLQASPASPITQVQTVTLTATLSPFQYPAGVANPPYSTDYETIEFWDKTANKQISSGELQKGKATSPPLTLQSGTYQLYAKYPGDTYFLNTDNSASPLSYTVGPPPIGTITTLDIANQSGVVSTLTATVVDAQTNEVKSGTVKFCVATASYCTGANLLGTAQLDQSGKAALDVYMVGRGASALEAVFEGTMTYQASASQPTLAPAGAIKPASTTTTLDANGANPNATLTATVTSTNAGSPDGWVALKNFDTGKLLENAQLIPGATTLTVQGTAVSSGGAAPISIGVADFDGDHILDLATANSGNVVSLWKGSGTGTFTAFPAPTVPATSPQDVVVADFDNDGVLDFVVAQNSAGRGVLPYQGNATAGVGNGTFTAKTEITTDQPYAVAAGDFDGNGLLDVAVASAQANSVSVWLNQGSWAFIKAPQSPVSVGAGMSPQAIAAADFNKDGKLDVAVANTAGKSITILLGAGDGNGDGSLKVAAGGPISLTGTKAPQGMVQGDFNNDGQPDLATANADNTVTVLLGDRYLSFVQTNVTVTDGTALSAIAAADLNADGWQDVAVTDKTANFIAVLLNDQAGKLGPTPATQMHTTAATSVISIATGDFNQDGEPDVLAGNAATNMQLAKLELSGTSTTQPYAVGDLQVTTKFEADYLGDVDFASSGPAYTTVQGKAKPTAATTLSPSGGTLKLPTTLTATVTGVTGYPAPTGKVQFMVDNVNFGDPVQLLIQSVTPPVSTAPLSLKAGSLTVGTHTITATYSGDSSYEPGTPATGGYTVPPHAFVVTEDGTQEGSTRPSEPLREQPVAPTRANKAQPATPKRDSGK